MRAIFRWLHSASNNTLLGVLVALYLTRDSLRDLFEALSISGVGFVSWLQGPVSIPTWVYLVWVLYSAIALGLLSIPVTRWGRRWLAEKLISLQQRLKGWLRGLLVDNGAQNPVSLEAQTTVHESNESSTWQDSPAVLAPHPLPTKFVKASKLKNAIKQHAADTNAIEPHEAGGPESKRSQAPIEKNKDSPHGLRKQLKKQYTADGEKPGSSSNSLAPKLARLKSLSEAIRSQKSVAVMASEGVLELEILRYLLESDLGQGLRRKHLFEHFEVYDDDILMIEALRSLKEAGHISTRAGETLSSGLRALYYSVTSEGVLHFTEAKR